MPKQNILTGWEETTLGEVCDIKYGKDHKELREGNIPCFGSGGFMRNVERPLYNKPSVLIPRKGTISNLFFVKVPFWTVDTLFYTKINEDKILAKFLFYKLKNEKLENLNVGSAVPSLTTDVLNQFSLSLPPLPEQGAIADMLSSFDNKIELLREQNKTLETTAQTIFQEWFGKYTVDGDLPEGWGVGKVDNILNRQNCAKRYSVEDVSTEGSTPVYEQGQSILLGYTDDKPSFNASIDYPMFIFGDHTCITKLLVGPFSLSGNIIPIKGVKYPTLWVYYAIYGLQKFIEYRRHWMELIHKQIVLPDVSLTENFVTHIKPMISKIAENEKQIHTLSKTRDELLPRLMSGEVRVV